MRFLTAMLCSMLGASALAGSLQVVLDPDHEFEEVVTGLELPTTMAFIGPDDILVLQKNDGRVRRVLGGTIVDDALDVAVDGSSERGLLGIATDPDFQNNGFVYLYYTESSTGTDTMATPPPLGNRIYRYRWNGSALVEPRLVLQLQKLSGGPHNAGVMEFGPDDKLYVVVGNSGQCCLPSTAGKLQNNPDGHDPDDAGVVLRLERNGEPPRDNPFYDTSFADGDMRRVFAYGIRNNFGLDFDPVGGDPWIGEPGPQEIAEVNRVFAGMNGGHHVILGPDSLDPDDVDDLWMAPGAAYGDPAFTWLDKVTPVAVGFIRSAKAGCDAVGDMLVTSHNCRAIYRFKLSPDRQSLTFTDPALQDAIANNLSDRCNEEQSEIQYATGPPTNSDLLTDIVTGPDGLVYVLSHSHGTIRRIVPVAGVPDDDGDQVQNPCDCDPGDASAYGFPTEVPRLRLGRSGHAATLGWDSQAPVAGSGTVYSVVSGTLASLAADGSFARSCTLVDGSSSARADDARALARGDGFYYLVRAANACDTASFGDGTPAVDPRDPRDALDAALPVACR